MATPRRPALVIDSKTLISTNGAPIYMSTQAMVWALEDAPDVPAQALGVLMGLANHADEFGRGAWPDQQTLAGYARKSDRSCRSDLTMLEELGLIRRGDQSLVAHLAPNKRPVVWDVAMERRRERTGRNHASGRNSASGRKSGAEQGESAGGESEPGSGLPGGSERPAGSTAQTGRKPASDKPSVEPSGSGSLPTGENKDARTRDSTSGDSSKPKRKRATRAELDEREAQAQDLTTKFFERYTTAQQFIAIRQVLRGALGNGIGRDDLARAIDRLGREGKPISGASLQFVLGQLAEDRQKRGGNGRDSPTARPQSGARAHTPSAEELEQTEIDI